jgi:hypothetical protein
VDELSFSTGNDVQLLTDATNSSVREAVGYLGQKILVAACKAFPMRLAPNFLLPFYLQSSRSRF